LRVTFAAPPEDNTAVIPEDAAEGERGQVTFMTGIKKESCPMFTPVAVPELESQTTILKSRSGMTRVTGEERF